MAGRMQFEANPEIRIRFVANFRDVAERYRAALKRALPDVAEEELYWRVHFVIGAMIHTWTNHQDVVLVSQGKCQFTGDDDMVKRLVGFAVAGLRADTTSKRAGSPTV